MDCDLRTFVSELLGKYGFTMFDWCILQQAYDNERNIKSLKTKSDEHQQYLMDQMGKGEYMICCENFKEAIKTETDNEGYGSAIKYSYFKKHYEIGIIRDPIKFCPWCGDKKIGGIK